jgi:hypothetical protein
MPAFSKLNREPYRNGSRQPALTIATPRNYRAMVAPPFTVIPRLVRGICRRTELDQVARTSRIRIRLRFRYGRNSPPTSCSGSTRASVAPRKSARPGAVRRRNDPLAKPEDDDKVRIPPISPLNLMPMRLVRATWADTVPRQVGRLVRAMTLKGRCDRSIIGAAGITLTFIPTALHFFYDFQSS